MTRWQRVIVTVLAMIGALALLAAAVATAALWPQWFFPLLTLAVFVYLVVMLLIWGARFIYKNLPRKD